MTKAFANDLKSNTRNAMIALLNKRLADAVDLKLAIKQAHWNIKGPGFIAVHELFDAVAARIEDHGDTLAERIVQLGGIAAGTTQAAAAATSLAAYPLDASAQADHLKAVSDRLGAFAKSCREGIDEADTAGDAVTADIFTSVARAVDKDHWFVGAHLA
ncbi:DNA starvation/stationary phase protection protein Dps [Phreatobacter sp. AB_2022a]|uniref:DNA starvation/stationary phase protection protein Dps n=1 Tax=Phreatobacter sp. AB_2022a TaxID=3003134 RepID=UPI00228713B3|nr:DNA starvation/stationary phase protection protein Dps [Phreatobacter sp. AB_2022a]MCZ0734628.1 DNA starvation/stationary phase protection protein Dps [Phreatobacter sp. AB_2022a]